MNEMLKRIVDVLTMNTLYCVKYAINTQRWHICKDNVSIFSSKFPYEAEDRCEQLNREWLAREIVQCMREPTDEQRNNYYELAFKTEVMHDAHWERAIDAILKVENDR